MRLYRARIVVPPIVVGSDFDFGFGRLHLLVI